MWRLVEPVRLVVAGDNPCLTHLRNVAVGPLRAYLSANHHFAFTTGKQNQSLSSQIQRRAWGVEPGSSGAAPHLATNWPSLLHPASTLFDPAFLWRLLTEANRQLNPLQRKLFRNFRTF